MACGAPRARRFLAGRLDLPRFKGAPGWEFTDLGKFDLDAFGPAPADAELDAARAAVRGCPSAHQPGQVDGASDAGEAGRRRPARHAAVVAAREHPELVEPYLGSIVPADDDTFVAANDAGWAGGAFVYVPRGVKVDAPILLTAVTAAAGTALHRRVLIVLEEGAEAEVWEQYLSADDDPRRCSTPSSSSSSGRTRGCATSAARTSTRSRGSSAPSAPRCSATASSTGSRSASARRAAACAWRPRSPARAPRRKVTGAYAPHARQHVDFDTTQEHAAANTFSDLAFRGILADRSSAVWRGMIKVDPGAQQTDAFQECRNLLLSKSAHADAIPGLEILANDVRCTHAAAIAQIDKDQLFYLRSRGLPEPQAQRLVIEGFMAELVERFEEGPVRDALAGALERRLATVLD